MEELVKSYINILNNENISYYNYYKTKYCSNSTKINDDLKDSGAFDKIRDYLINDNGIVYGGSAGAIIFGKDLDSCNTDDENKWD